MKRLFLSGLLLSTLFFTACGGGGGGTSSGGGGTPPSPTPTTSTVMLRISTKGTLPQGVSLSGVGITVNLPSSVTVKTDSNGNVQSSVVNASGVALGSAVLPPVYASGQLTFVLASSVASGFGVGEFATVYCDVKSGSTAPTQADFSLSGLTASSTTYQKITTLSSELTATVQ